MNICDYIMWIWIDAALDLGVTPKEVGDVYDEKLSDGRSRYEGRSTFILPSM